MVILVTGLSLVGYLLAKVLGDRKGTLLAGIVGGLVSSTAVALTMSRRSKEHPKGAHTVAAVSIIAATATLYPRLLLETWAFNKPLALQLLVPLAIVTVVAFAIARLIFKRNEANDGVEIPLTNPLNLSVALQFAVIYMAVQWLIALASAHGNTAGLYGTSLVFGTTDMDAITLSIARSTVNGDTTTGAIAILLATMSNTVMKFLIVLFFGHRALWKWVGIGFASVLLATLLGLAVVVLA
jgi:uncharacterized membrane protein (DUF4010 family)